MTRRGYAMDTDELHDQLREIAATDSIHAAAYRDQIESRARLHRRNRRRRVVSGIVVLSITGLLGVILVLVNGGGGRQSVRIPPAQSADTATSPTSSPSAA